jgi:hypothetical protein
MNSTCKDIVFLKVREALQLKSYRSAEALLTLFTSSISKESTDQSSLKAEAEELLGDILYENAEYKRALNCYQHSSQMKKLWLLKSNKKSSSSLVNDFVDPELAYKSSLCYIHLKDNAMATRELEAIPEKQRPIKIHLQLGIDMLTVFTDSFCKFYHT